MGGERRLWECGEPDRVFHHFHGLSQGGKGEVTFSLRPRRGRSWLPLSPLPARRRFPAAAVFLFATFSFGGGFMRRPKRGPKPENSRTVNQWGMRGRVPIDPLKPEYVWDNYYGVPQSIYYLEDNTREMTEEERADFLADRKAFCQRYVKLIAAEIERLEEEAREKG